jgi:hypothetical protein
VAAFCILHFDGGLLSLSQIVKGRMQSKVPNSRLSFFKTRKTAAFSYISLSALPSLDIKDCSNLQVLSISNIHLFTHYMLI